MKRIIMITYAMFVFSFAIFSNSQNEGKRDKTISELIKIELKGVIALSNLEASSLAWYKDNLIILPQFPHKWGDKFDGSIFFIPKVRIEQYLNGKNIDPIGGTQIHFEAKGLDEIGKSKGSGYEAITFDGDSLYVSIESVNLDQSTSYVVAGVIDFDEKKITLSAESKIEVKSQTDIHNMAEETIFTFESSIYTIHEANGKNINKSPEANQISKDLEESEKINFPNIEYRITDATAVDSQGKFYAVNYFYPGEYTKLKPDLNEEEKDKAIEQILEFQILDDQIIRTGKPPLVISKGVNKKSSNWEGIVKLNDGFLLITDRFPDTRLIFCK